MRKFNKILSCVLSLIILLSAFPSTVYASSETFTPETAIIDVSGSGLNPSFKYSSNPCYSSYGTYSSLNYYRIDCIADFSVNKGNVLTITINLNSPIYTNSLSAVVVGANSSTSVSYNFDTFENSGNSITFSFLISQDFNVTGFVFYVEGNAYDNYTYTCSGSTTFTVNISSITCEKSTETQGLVNRLKTWFNSIFEWFSELRDKISNLSSSIGSWFSELGNNIKSWFNDLISNIQTQFSDITSSLKTWFSNVGTWFSEIGDRISGFFSDLWNNISLKVESITDSIIEWWQSVKDFFHSLFVPEDGYFDTYKENWESWAKAHFGFFYDATELVDNLITRLDVSFSGSTLSKGRFSIPEIRLPFLDKPVILKETSFHLFGDLIVKNSQIKWVYNTYQLVVTALSFFFIIKFAINTFNQVIGERE